MAVIVYPILLRARASRLDGILWPQGQGNLLCNISRSMSQNRLLLSKAREVCEHWLVSSSSQVFNKVAGCTKRRIITQNRASGDIPESLSLEEEQRSIPSNTHICDPLLSLSFAYIAQFHAQM